MWDKLTYMNIVTTACMTHITFAIFIAPVWSESASQTLLRCEALPLTCHLCCYVRMWWECRGSSLDGNGERWRWHGNGDSNDDDNGGNNRYCVFSIQNPMACKLPIIRCPKKIAIGFYHRSPSTRTYPYMHVHWISASEGLVEAVFSGHDDLPLSVWHHLHAASPQWRWRQATTYSFKPSSCLMYIYICA